VREVLISVHTLSTIIISTSLINDIQTPPGGTPLEVRDEMLVAKQYPPTILILNPG
jgi:hypothetical protein